MESLQQDGADEQQAKFKKTTIVYINKRRSKAYMDSGNTYRTAISRQFMKKIGLTESDLMPVKAKVKTAAEGSTVRALGETKKPLTLQF